MTPKELSQKVYDLTDEERHRFIEEVSLELDRSLVYIRNPIASDVIPIKALAEKVYRRMFE